MSQNFTYYKDQKPNQTGNKYTDDLFPPNEKSLLGLDSNGTPIDQEAYNKAIGGLINKEKQIKNISGEKGRSYYICSSLSLNNVFPRSINNYISNDKNKYIKNRKNIKMSSYTLYDNNNSNLLNQSINQNFRNDNNINLRKSKSLINIYEK